MIPISTHIPNSKSPLTAHPKPNQRDFPCPLRSKHSKPISTKHQNKNKNKKSKPSINQSNQSNEIHRRFGKKTTHKAITNRKKKIDHLITHSKIPTKITQKKKARAASSSNQIQPQIYTRIRDQTARDFRL